MHAEIIKQALVLVHDESYKGAEDEFHKAFEHYRCGNNKEALAESLKAIESTVKAIAKKRGWIHPPNATAKALFDLIFEKQLVPQFWIQHYSALRSMLESGVPTVRNRLGGHGQGPEIIEVPPFLVAFALHQTASVIVFLVSAEKDLKI